MLGEQLRDGGQGLARDLVAGGVDLIFALRLPELIDPPQAVLGGEDLDRQLGDQLLQRPLVLRREADLEHGIVGPENLRQHPGRVTCRQRPAVRRTLVRRQLIALRQRDRHPFLLVNEQMVLGQEPGEQHPVPVLVGALVDQPVDRLGPAFGSRWSPSWRPCARSRLRSWRSSTLRCVPGSALPTVNRSTATLAAASAVRRACLTAASRRFRSWVGSGGMGCQFFSWITIDPKTVL